jgi:cation transport ATPase
MSSISFPLPEAISGNRAELMSSLKSYDVEGIDCLMCAKDVEAALREVPGLEHSRLDFAAGKIMIDPKQVDMARATLKTIEPDADIRDVTGYLQKPRNHRIRIPWTIPMSAGLWVVGMILFAWVPEAVWLRRVLYLAAYGFAGRRVVFGAFRNLFRGRVVDELFLMTLATAGAFVIGEWAEAVAVMLFYSVGEALQEGAVFAFQGRNPGYHGSQGRNGPPGGGRDRTPHLAGRCENRSHHRNPPRGNWCRWTEL